MVPLIDVEKYKIHSDESCIRRCDRAITAAFSIHINIDMYVYTSSLFRFQTIRDIISTHVSLERSCVFVCLHFRLKETNVNQSNSEGNILFFFTLYLSFSLSISFYTLFRLLQCNVSNVLCDFILYIYIQ